jgi:hypothetical protein
MSHTAKHSYNDNLRAEFVGFERVFHGIHRREDNSQVLRRVRWLH